MKKSLWMMMVATAVLLLAVTAWAERGLYERHERQSLRIAQGVRSGSITPYEMRRLERQQRRIEGSIHRAWRDGRLSRHERRQIHAMMDRASRQIRWAKHNDRFRRPHYGPPPYWHNPHPRPHYRPPRMRGYGWWPGWWGLAWTFHIR